MVTEQCDGQSVMTLLFMLSPLGSFMRKVKLFVLLQKLYARTTVPTCPISETARPMFVREKGLPS